MQRFFGTAALLLLLAVAAAAPRVALLLTAERWMDGDECVVGIMAKHIADGTDYPVFFYGQHYGGAHAIEAYAAAPFFHRFGKSDFPVQTVPLVFSIGVVLLTFLIIRSIEGSAAGFLCALILAFSTPFLKSSLKADGYIETIFFCLAALFAALRLAADPEPSPRRRLALVALTAFLLGFAVYCYDFALVYVVVIAVWLLWKRRINSIASVILFGFCFLAGAAILVWDNYAHDFLHINHLLHGRPYSEPFPAHVFHAFVQLFTHDFPLFLTKDCVHNFTPQTGHIHWVYYALVIVAALFSLRKLPAPFIAVPAAYTVLYVVSSFAGVSPRYLLPYEPFISIALGLFVYRLLIHAMPLRRPAAIVFAAALVWTLFIGNSAVFSDRSLVEGNVPTDPKSLVKVIGFLQKKNIQCVYTTYFIKWRLLFESWEEITAMDILYYQKIQGYLFYETRGCPSNARAAYVFNELSPYVYQAAGDAKKSGTPTRLARIGNHVVIYRDDGSIEGRHEAPGSGSPADRLSPAEKERILQNSGAEGDSPPDDATGKQDN